MALIILNTVYLALEGYTHENNNTDFTDYIAIIFLTEICIKVFGNGFKSIF